MNQAKRLYELDVLRGVAALGVVIFHYTSYGNGAVVPYKTEFWVNFNSGYYGVELFFIISGFVIFMTLEKLKSGMDFIIGRFSRLYPLYWASLLLTLPIMIFADKHSFNIIEIAANFTMVQTFFNIRHINQVSWTLSHELVFYGIMFAIYKLKWLHKIDLICLVWLAVIAIFSLIKNQDLWNIPGRLSILLLLDHGMFFIAGIAFYKIYKNGFKILPSVIIGLSLLSYLIHKHHGHPQIITFFVIFTLVVAGKMQRISFPPLVFLGTISYPLYLIHDRMGEIIIRYLHENIGMNVNLAMPIAISAVIITSTAMTIGIEKPAMIAIKQCYQNKSQEQKIN